MSKLSQQKLEIFYILSKVFDFGVNYKALLQQKYKLVQECKVILQDTRHIESLKGIIKKC